MSKVDREVYPTVIGLINPKIFPTDKMVLKIIYLVHDSINLSCSKDHIFIYSSQYFASTMGSPHNTNLFYQFSIVRIRNLIIVFSKIFNMCLKKFNSAN